ncbi:MAG: molybdate ABC transporter permease subunit [Bacillota bacterium]
MDWFPVLLSLKVAGWATLAALLSGVPLAWLLARKKPHGAALISSLVTLPMVLPPTVLGYYLLVLIGRQGFLGRLLAQSFGINLVFTWQGAVLAATLVSLPLLVHTVQAGLEGVDREMEDVARTLGRSEPAVFLTVTLPLAWPSLLAGMVLAFTRAMGEFGATLMVAGNIPGKTQTLSIAIYDAVQSGNTVLANTLVALVSGLTFLALLLLHRITLKRLI